MKKIICILGVMALIFTTEIEVHAEPTAPIYNNEEKVTRISNIDEEKWRTEWNAYGYYTADNIAECVGAEPYWRLGNTTYYAVYKIEDNGPHYLIMTFDKTFYYLREPWYVTKIPSKMLFKKYVDEGTPLDVVKLIDPDTYNIYEGDDLYYSYHRFADGTGARVKYQKNSQGKWIVVALRYSPDGYGIVKNLVDIDYQMIKNDNPNEEAEFLEKLKKLEEITTSDSNNSTISSTQIEKKKPAKVKIKSAKRIKKKRSL